MSTELDIAQAEVWLVSIPYRRPYGVSGGTATYGKHVVLKLTTSGGLVGLGESAVVIPERGATQEGTAADLKNYLLPAVMGHNALERERLWWAMDHLDLGRGAFSFAKAAVDQALWDIAGRYWNAPVYELLGGKFREEIGVTRSLPTGTPAEVAEAAIQLVEAGYQLLTLKTGRNPDTDVATAKAVREAIGPDVPLEIDPNQGYSVSQAVSILHQLESVNLSACEQPTPWWDLEGLARITNSTATPIIADESCSTQWDAARIASMRAADTLCIKLVAAGGITPALKIAAIGEASGLDVSLASRHVFGVGTSAIHHFAAATASVRPPIGYGSPAERYEADIIKQEIPFAKGIARPLEGPGFGVDLDDDALERYAVGSFSVKQD